MAVGSHHVPRFLLRRFSPSPGEKNSPIWTMDKASGRVVLTRVNSVAVINDYYRTSLGTKLPPDFVEHRTLGGIEEAAKPLVERLVTGEELAPRDRLHLALFLFAQYTRTPRLRAWTIELSGHSIQQRVLAALSDDSKIQRALRKRGQTTSGQAIEEYREEMYRILTNDKWRIEPNQDTQVLLMLHGIQEVAPLIAGSMTWICQRTTPDRPFVLCDHPLAIYDPVRSEGPGVGWFSSASVEVSIPLDPQLCLLLFPGAPSQISSEVDAGTVNHMNLKTFASAEWAIYGHTESVLRDVQALAQANVETVERYRPQPPALITLERYANAEHYHAINVVQPKEKSKRGRTSPRHSSKTAKL